MFRALWFMFKVGLLVVLSVWIADRPGTVRIEWMDYEITVQTGFFLLLVLFFVLVAIFIHGIWHAFTRLPENFRKHLRLRRREKGYRALTLGLAAVAAGDKKAAAYQAYRATHLLPEDKGLPLLLEAQAARLNGRAEEAKKIFQELSENRDAGFLGVRGLLQAALDSGQHEQARAMAQRALELQPRQGWILKLAYQLEVKAGRWNEARAILYRAQKAGVVSGEQGNSDRIAILLAEAEEFRQEGATQEMLHNLQKAYRYGPEFPPAVLRLAEYYRLAGKRSQAVRLIEKAWRRNPHPQLVAPWDLLISPKKSGQPMARLVWRERLMTLNSQSAESYLAVGQAAMTEGLWGEARNHFLKAETIQASPRLYKLQAELEKRLTRNEENVAALLEKAAAAPPEKCWVCRETGRVYEVWSPVALPHGSFNTIVWDYPEDVNTAMAPSNPPPQDELMDSPNLGMRLTRV